MWRYNKKGITLRAEVHKLKHTSASPGRLVRIQTAGPQPQSFPFTRSKVGPENVHFYQGPDKVDATALRDPILRTTDLEVKGTSSGITWVQVLLTNSTVSDKLLDFSMPKFPNS